jgi:UDP-N-acetylmuramyl pentapeptide phosphotransferase/UDP-N-acetylglucosamine-1-phosphate transferase
MLQELSFFNFLVQRDFLWIFPAVFSVGLALFTTLYFAQSSRFGVLRKALYIPARKSITNAIQLGGLPLALSIIFGVVQVFYHPNFYSFFSDFDYYSIKYWLVSSVVIMTYGYLDDRFELRPIVKLSLQILSICLFAVLESRVLFPKWGALAFVVISFWGLGVLNGSNLLDGLDTLTIKLGAVTFSCYLVISYNFSIASGTVGSLIGLSALSAFYIFNKEPAKIHLGEIGGSFVGFTSILVSCFVYSFLTRIKVGHLNAMAMCLMPLSLPMVELAVSFLRRLYAKKSPFKGDKFHLHHLLRNYYGLSPSHASSVYAGGYAAVMAVGFSITHYFGPVIGFVGVNILLAASYILVGHKHWKISDGLHPKDLFQFLLKKDVGVINSFEVDDFEIQIIGLDEFKENESPNEESDSDSGEKKVA